jgi:hypothetical protein|tara:strand:- start:173 stop:397 length:225 start_codon:yes stop_codon:yes gene_type:complete
MDDVLLKLMANPKYLKRETKYKQPNYFKEELKKNFSNYTINDMIYKELIVSIEDILINNELNLIMNDIIDSIHV